jgi:Fe-S cluster assembly protein SufD
MMADSDVSPLLGSTLRAMDARETLGPAWLDVRRNAAADRLVSTGLPNNREEAWRFTPLRPLSRLAFSSAAEPSSTAVEALIPAMPDDTLRAVTANGRVVTLPQTPNAGVRVLSLGLALQESPERIEAHLMRLSSGRGGFSAQNDALFRDAIVIIAERNAILEQPLVVVHTATAEGEPNAVCPRVLLIAEPGSSLALVEFFVSRGDAPRLQSAVTEIVASAESSVEHLRIQIGQREDFTVSSVEVEQDRDSSFSSRVFTAGGALSRVDLQIRLSGGGATCNLDGLYVAMAGEHVDHHTTVQHRVPRTSSNQLYKGIVGNDGHAVFDGTVVVHRDASGTEAHQKNQNLLLAEGGTVHTKPHLEIDTDDVVCSHGATVGRLDHDQVFYLRSRGIDTDEAQAMLVDAFARDMVERVEHPGLRRLTYRVMRDVTGSRTQSLSEAS